MRTGGTVRVVRSMNEAQPLFLGGGGPLRRRGEACGIDREDRQTMNEQHTQSVFVTTPTGNIGRHVAAQLIEDGHPVSVLVRDGSQVRLPEVVRERAQVFTGGMDDPDALTRASVGATGMFLALPPDPRTEDLAAQWASFTDAAVAAIRANAITHVVLVSTQGAGPDRGPPGHQ
ncbi:hypothetical protein E4A47_11430 [Micrococcus flavus]|nr:hypothetical protein E4A47_11430 [Micrococcus flavus]